MKNDRKRLLNSRLREARSAHGWSQQELANLIGTTAVNIARLENGTTFPSPYFRQRLIEVFGKTLDELGLSPISPPIPRIWNVPITRDPYFTGREDLLALLHRRLSSTGMPAMTQPQALCGLGGIGKTQTAAEYAYRYGDKYAHVFWILAATRETLVADFVRLANLLELPERDTQDQPQIVAAVKGWLAERDGWLLILDNADDLRMAQEFLPPRHKGYVLFTTRAQAAGLIAASIEVEQLTLQESTLLLLRRANFLDLESPLDNAPTADHAVAQHIVRELDGLPLAITQAGAYIEETGCRLEDYLSLFKTHGKELLARRSSLVFNYPETVATTWALSFQQVEQQSPTAAEILRLCAFLAPDAIPEELLISGITKKGDEGVVFPGDLFELAEALEVLRRYSLVRRNRGMRMLTIHRLVQSVIKESMDEETQRAWAERTVRAIYRRYPHIEFSTWPACRPLRPHLQVSEALIRQWDMSSLEATSLLDRLRSKEGYAFYHIESHLEASEEEVRYERDLAIFEKTLGPEHLDVGICLNKLARIYFIQGKYDQARSFYLRALKILEKTLGARHPSVTTCQKELEVLQDNLTKYA